MTVYGPVLGLAGAILGACLPSSPACAQGYDFEDPATLSVLPSVPRYRAFLPARKDLAAEFPPPGNQGDQGSCVAWSLGYALRSYYEHKRTQAPYASRAAEFSPAYLYNQLTEDPRACQKGLNLHQAVTYIENHGIATLADFPYDDRNCSRRPSAQVAEAAASHRIKSRAFKNDLIVDDLKGMLRDGDPFVAGLHVDGRALSSLPPGKAYDLDSGASTEGHAIAIVGYDDTRQAFKFMNSWGPGWGEDGFGWISYRAFIKDAHALASMDDSEGPPPAPTPAPAPSPGPAPTPDVADWPQRILDLARGFECSVISVKLDGDAGKVSGWVGRQEDLDALNRAATALAPLVQVALDVDLFPWPQCEALTTLSESVQDHGLKLATLDHEGTTYLAGSKLAVRITTPDFPSYLYVTYIEANGDAVELYKPRGTVPQALPRGSVVTLGGGEDHRVFRVGAPFGHEMLVAIAAASPLFTDGLPPKLTEREYLTALRKTLEYKPDPDQKSRVVDGGAIPLTTQDAPPPPRAPTLSPSTP